MNKITCSQIKAIILQAHVKRKQTALISTFTAIKTQRYWKESVGMWHAF